MKKATFKDFSEKEIRELLEKQNEAVKIYKNKNKNNNILLFGICDYGNRIISNIKEITKVTKLFSDTDKKQLENLNENNTFLFLQNYKLSEGILDKNNYSKIYKHIIKNKNEIIEKIKDYDYIVICTRSNDKMDSCLTEAVADICAEIGKRFMVCHSTDIILLLGQNKLSKRRSSRFINKMKKKKYILNEIACIDINFLCGKVDFDYHGQKYCSYIYTGFNPDFNVKVFADTVEYGIINMLEE